MVRLVVAMHVVMHAVMVMVMMALMNFTFTANSVPARSHVDPYRIVIFHFGDYLEPAGDRMLLGD